MNWFAGQIDPDATVAQFHLLGRVDFESVLALQQRLVFEAGESVGRQITVLICEHPEVLTIGRNGSRAHIRLSEQQLARRRLPIRWVASQVAGSLKSLEPLQAPVETSPTQP